MIQATWLVVSSPWWSGLAGAGWRAASAWAYWRVSRTARTDLAGQDAAALYALLQQVARDHQAAAGQARTAGAHPRAVSLTLEELHARLAELPDGAEIVAYCRGANCVLAHDSVRRLAACGRAARRLADGMLEWRLDGLPVAAGRPA